MPLNRVVITGMGAVSPYGVGMPVMMDHLYKGKSAVINMKADWEKEVTDLNCWVGAPLQGQLNAKSIPRKFRKTMGKTAIMSYIAANEAVTQAGINEDQLVSGNLGVSFGSSTGSVHSTETFFGEPYRNQSIRNLSSGIFFQIMSHTDAANIAQAMNIRGRVISANSACSSSAQSIGLAYEFIRNGIQDFMLCGGSDELHAMTAASFDLVQAASYKYNDQPSKTPRPFDSDRDGTVCSDGAGCIVLESEASAKARGAEIIAEIIGFSTLSSGVHIAQADKESAAVTLQAALKNAGISAAEIDYINAHATGTLIGDIAEAQALKEVFGSHIIPVSSFKGHMGHTLGASGVLELAATLQMMHDGLIIPTLNLDTIDEQCIGLNYVRETEEKSINTLIKNSFAFGGINTVLIAKRYQA